MNDRIFGPAYDKNIDGKRIHNQTLKIRDYMLLVGSLGKGHWKTLGEIEEVLKYPQASISAQLRHLRKKEFGSYVVEKRRRGILWEYLVSLPDIGGVKQLDLFESAA